MGNTDADPEFERGYVEGNRRAYLSMLRFVRAEVGEAEARALNWLIERQEVIAKLRDLCARFGDNDWGDDLHLGDVIEKHLGDYLEGGEEDVEEAWAADKPTVPGYYWYREPGSNRAPVVIFVAYGPGSPEELVAFRHGIDGAWRTLIQLTGEWSGRIELPD